MVLRNKKYTFGKNKQRKFSIMYQSPIIPSVSNCVVDEQGNVYKSIRSLAKILGVHRDCLCDRFKMGKPYKKDGHTYMLMSKQNTPVEITPEQQQPALDPDYEQFLKTREIGELPFEIYDFKFSQPKAGNRYAVALFSDAHIEETVTPDSVLGLNEYNINIAKKRIERYFVNLANCLNVDEVDVVHHNYYLRAWVAVLVDPGIRLYL